MQNSPNVAFRFSESDKAALKELAARLQMNQTNTVRALVRETLAILKEREGSAGSDIEPSEKGTVHDE
jgi:hypothetical protein